MSNLSMHSDHTLQRVVSLPFEGTTIGTQELLDLLQRAVANIRTTDPETAEYALHDVRFRFKKEGIDVVAEFRK